MHESTTYQVHVGAAGWGQNQANPFYPEDLPPEWRLTYYNNFFSCVYLSYAEWSQQKEATLKQWLVDVLPRFRFVLQLPAGGPSIADIEKLQAFGAQVGMLVAGDKSPEGLLWLEDFPTQQGVLQRAKALAERGIQVFIISRGNNFATLEGIVSQLEMAQM